MPDDDFAIEGEEEAPSPEMEMPNDSIEQPLPFDPSVGTTGDHPPENQIEADYNIMTPAEKVPGVSRDLVLSVLTKNDMEELGHLQGAWLQCLNIERAGKFVFPSLSLFVKSRYLFLVNGKRGLGGKTLDALKMHQQRNVQVNEERRLPTPRKKIFGLI